MTPQPRWLVTGARRLGSRDVRRVVKTQGPYETHRCVQSNSMNQEKRNGLMVLSPFLITVYSLWRHLTTAQPLIPIRVDVSWKLNNGSAVMDVVVKWECQLCSTENTKSYQCCCTWTARSRSSASWFVFLSIYLMNKTWLLLHVVASLDSVSSTGRIRARVTCRFSLPLPHFYWTEYKTRNKKGWGAR